MWDYFWLFPTNWIFCAMAQTLAITAKVTNLGGKESQPLCLGKQILLWFAQYRGMGEAERIKMNQTKPSKLHTPPSACPSVLSLAAATAKPAEQGWILPRKQLLELPQASAARGGVWHCWESPDLHWHSCKERAHKLGFFKCRIPRGMHGGNNLNYLIRNYNGNFQSRQTSVHLDKCPVSRCSVRNPIMDSMGRTSHKKASS